MRQGKPCEPGYHLPETAHEQLQTLRDHLHLLAALSQPHGAHPDDLILPRPGLAHCFQDLAHTTDQILETLTWQPD